MRIHEKVTIGFLAAFSAVAEGCPIEIPDCHRIDEAHVCSIGGDTPNKRQIVATGRLETAAQVNLILRATEQREPGEQEYRDALQDGNFSFYEETFTKQEARVLEAGRFRLGVDIDTALTLDEVLLYASPQNTTTCNGKGKDFTFSEDRERIKGGQNHESIIPIFSCLSHQED